MLSFEPESKEMALRKRAIAEGEDYEDFMLHFSEDTTIDLPTPTHGSDTPLAGVPWIVGYTAGPTHAGFWLYQSPPWNKAVWQDAANDGGLHVYSFERFDALTLTLASAAGDGQLVVQYPSATVVSPNGAQKFVSAWSDLTLLTDGTNGLQQSGTITFVPPSDWAFANTHDGSGATYGGGPYFVTVIRDGGLAYTLRLMWRGGNTANGTPVLDYVQMRRWITEVVLGDPAKQTVPGWDAANDVNGDGYVDATERGSLVNPSATARFRYEARAVPLGRMWSAQSSWCRVNPWNSLLGVYLGEFLQADWAKRGFSGAYNDDLLKLVSLRTTRQHYRGNLLFLCLLSLSLTKHTGRAGRVPGFDWGCACRVPKRHCPIRGRALSFSLAPLLLPRTPTL